MTYISDFNCWLIQIQIVENRNFPLLACSFKLTYFLSKQRPLKTIAKRSGDVYIPRGVSVPALDKDILWEFQPKKIGTAENIFPFYR